MDGIEEMVRDVAVTLERLEAERERAIALSRTVIRITKRIIHAIHLGEPYDLVDLRKAAEELMDVSDEPEVVGSSRDALAEFAEACILSSLVRKEKMPSFSDIGITPQAWVMGLADCIGELRRIVLDSVLRNDTAEAERTFACMEAIYEEIMMLDVPDAVLPIRRKQDVARSVMERTRTDLVNAVRR